MNFLVESSFSPTRSPKWRRSLICLASYLSLCTILKLKNTDTISGHLLACLFTCEKQVSLLRRTSHEHLLVLPGSQRVQTQESAPLRQKPQSTWLTFSHSGWTIHIRRRPHTTASEIVLEGRSVRCLVYRTVPGRLPLPLVEIIEEVGRRRRIRAGNKVNTGDSQSGVDLTFMQQWILGDRTATMQLRSNRA